MTFKPTRTPPQKRGSLSQLVLSQLRKISIARRNDIRGALSDARISATSDQTKRLRANESPEDMIAASVMLNAPTGLRKRQVQGLKQVELWRLHSQDCKSLEAEVAYGCGFVNSWPLESLKAIGTIGLLSRIADVPLSDAIGAIESSCREWGASRYLSYKIAYLKIQPGLTDENQAQLNEIDKLIGHGESPGIQFSAIENLKNRISIFSIAQRHTNTLADRVTGEFRRSHSLSNIVATPFSDEDCAAYILLSAETSLIDTIYALWAVLNIADRFGGVDTFVEKYLDPEIHRHLKEIMELTQSSPVPELNLQQISSDLNEDASLTYYRLSAAFLENKKLCEYRNDIDRVVGYRLISNLLKNRHQRGKLDFDYVDVLLKPNSQFALDDHGSPNVGIDGFYRTYLFLRFLESPTNLAFLKSPEIAYIFDNTVALEALLFEDELKTMHINASPEAQALISVLALGPVDKVDSQISGSMIQDCLLGGGFGSRRPDRYGMADHRGAVAHRAWKKITSRAR